MMIYIFFTTWLYKIIKMRGTVYYNCNRLEAIESTRDYNIHKQKLDSINKSISPFSNKTFILI
jgi:hypothetical protein